MPQETLLETRQPRPTRHPWRSVPVDDVIYIAGIHEEGTTEYLAQIINLDDSDSTWPNATLIEAAPDLLRESEIAAESMRRIAANIAGDTYLGEFANDLRMIAINLENVARKARGDK